MRRKETRRVDLAPSLFQVRQKESVEGTGGRKTELPNQTYYRLTYVFRY